MAGLTGAIPSFYREIYDIVCLGSCTKVSRSLWQRCFSTAALPDTLLGQIWEVCDPTGSGSIGRDGLYKSLALTALAQQGKGVEEKALRQFGDTELPIPKLATSSELRDIVMRLVRETVPTELGYSFEDLQALDDITVTLVPEKKGVVFKHVEYTVESSSHKSVVLRRFRDFEAFHEILSVRFPYRLVPRMPPKKLAASSTFLEQRRRALKRFLLLIVRHPTLARDEVVRNFLTAGGHEVGQRLKDKYKSTKDELYFNEHVKRVEELVSDETRVKYDSVRVQIATMFRIMTEMLQVAHHLEERSVGLSNDMKLLGTNLSTLATHSSLASSWTSGSEESWSYMKSDCKKLSEHFFSLSQKAHDQAVRETSGFTESVHLFLDLITAYQDLCDRREKNVQKKHQKAMAKVHTMVNYKEHMESQGRHMSDKEDNRLLRRDDELIMIEKRNFFSLFCLDLEAQLINVNLAQLPDIFHHLIRAEMIGTTEYQGVWSELQPLVDTMGGSLKSPDPSSPTQRGRLSGSGAQAADSASPFV